MSTYDLPPAASTTPAPPKRKRRVFVWFFLAVQAIFLVWIITGMASGAESNCKPGDQLCRDAEDVGTGIGVALLFVFWCVVDFILGVSYVIYRLARRP